MKKFTLMELLLVFAIIGVLTSLLIPNIGRARQKSKQVVCASQIQQNGIAVTQYQHDNSNYMPSTVNPVKAWKWHIAWRYYLRPYLGLDFNDISKKGNKPFTCPSSQIDGSHKNYVDQQIAFEAGTGFNTNWGTLRWPDILPLRKITHADKPSETVVIGDTSDGSNFDTAVKLANGSTDKISRRHNNGLNILWADGHIKHYSNVKMAAGKNGSASYFYQINK